ncbi:MAG: HEAT repeat domain-containing protein [Candidatus Marinimicrobia bacterium]|jgi:hypothetical protein|nr:HEAT repeat domain-containing protein [Candidatus Neomarinimicrobiota bacterium]MBT3496163.1 HEAT repeat domain-containing protein [Candidatus Neomarinimicrobiota bacterium]MBT3692801.1 HEAT repeat domain-containing protein [Candidatus Neomarinimicrobiota bacterium]MBT3731834.1 HEAT repeat domain-containing protein [Candidatus Neomarinimicrobiota bacterium]MBT4145077.1 HEAT repeat domain-containing protein [Candidatus Neomarinimicrobiota bacterium]
MKDLLKEQAVLYVLDTLDSNEKSDFELEMTKDKSLKKWVSEYQSTLKLANDSQTQPVSKGYLNAQRFSLRNKIESISSQKSDSYHPAIPTINKIIQVKQPVWMSIFAIILSFFIGKTFVSSAPESDNNSLDILQLMNDGLLTNIDIKLNEDENNPIHFAVHASNKMEYSGDLKDDLIRDILFYLLLNDENLGKRIKAVNLLKQTRLEEKGQMVLISSMLSDPNPGVRLKSAKMLQSYSVNALLIDACVKTILEDKNSAVRLSAMDILEAHPTAEMIPALQVIRIMEKNAFIRARAESILADFEDLNNGQLSPEI